MSEGSLISKLSMIYEGWTEKPKTDEDWFKDRLAHCEPCEYNSANKNLSVIEKAKEIAFGEHYCSACGCPFSKKLSVKRSTCGMVEVGKTPLWYPLAADGSHISKGTYLENPGNRPYTVSQEHGFYNLNFGEISEDSVDIDFNLFVPIRYKLIAAIGTCSCTHIEAKMTGPGVYNIKGTLSTISFSKGFPITRTVEVRFSDKLKIFVNLNLKMK